MYINALVADEIQLIRKLFYRTREIPAHKMAPTAPWFVYYALLPLVSAVVNIMPMGDSTTAVVGFVQCLSLLD
jgi:hypothetical protein